MQMQALVFPLLLPAHLAFNAGQTQSSTLQRIKDADVASASVDSVQELILSLLPVLPRAARLALTRVSLHIHFTATRCRLQAQGCMKIACTHDTAVTYAWADTNCCNMCFCGPQRHATSVNSLESVLCSAAWMVF